MKQSKKSVQTPIKKFLTRVGLPIVLLAVSVAPAYAERPGLYIGAGWGAYQINESNLDDNDDLLKAYFGAQFSSWFAIEGSWVDFDRTSGNNGNRFETDGKGIAAVFSFPMTDSSSFYVKAGQFWWDADSSFGNSVSSNDGDDPFFGLGFKLALSKVVALRVEAERYDIDNRDLDTASVSLQFNF